MTTPTTAAKDVEILKVILTCDEDGRFNVNVIQGAQASQIFPANFLQYLCCNIGDFTASMIKQLESKPITPDESPKNKLF
jgi:hypothetical protein